MSKIIYFFTFIFTISLITFACTGESELTNSTPTKLDSEELNLRFANNQIKDVTIYCRGECECATHGTIEPDGSHYVECSCDPCTMTLKHKSLNGNITTTEILNGRHEVKFLDLLENHISIKFSTTNFTIDSVEIKIADEDNYSYLYSYNANGNEDSVMFAVTGGSGGTTHEITCTSSDCVCKERYVFADPPYSECSCDPCTMTVTEVK